MEIEFTVGGELFRVDFGAYSKSRIILPDGTMLTDLAWNESDPPKLIGFEVLPYGGTKALDQLAKLYDGVVARKV